jgi:hypothetical protein
MNNENPIYIYRTCGLGKYISERCNLLNKIIVENYPDLINKINHINDHKGTLNVYWSIEPNEFEKNQLLKLWDVFNEYEIEHFIVSYKKI